MLDDLRAVLRNYPGDLQPIGELEDLGSAGGSSGSHLWRWAAVRGNVLARRWPAQEWGKSRIGLVHGWLSEAAHLPFVAVPFRGTVGRTFFFLGPHGWDLSPWLPGTPDHSPHPAVSKVRAASQALGKFHQALAGQSRMGPSPGLVARYEEVAALLSGGFEQFGLALQTTTPDRRTDLGLRWLQAARSSAPGLLDELRRSAAREVSRQPCLRDARPEHFLFEVDRVTGLVDYGAMGEESVAADLARLQSEWFGMEPFLSGASLGSYQSVRPLADQEVALVGVFARSSGLLIGAHWLRWHYLEGRHFADPRAVEKGLEKGLDRAVVLSWPSGRKIDPSAS